MNPIEDYRDPALDVLFAPKVQATEAIPAASRSRSNRHSRQASMATREALPPTNSRGQDVVSPAAEITGPTGLGVQRSFSQRARGRPFADEAYANDSLADSAVPAPLGKSARDSLPPQAPVSQPLTVVDPILPAANRQSRRQQIIQDNIRSAAEAADSSRNSRERRSDPVADPLDGNLAGLARAPTTREVAPQEQRDWAPDRSPLQKLEVTLNDISKEEKRARVQEAEMLHREKTQSQRSPARADLTSSRAAPGPSTIEDLGVVRNLSNTHKDRLQHSTVIESRKPDPTALTSSSPGFNYSSAFPPSRSVTITRRSRQGASLVTQSPSQRATSSSYASPPLAVPEPIAQARSVSATQPATFTVPSTGFTSQDSRPTRTRQILDADRIPTSQERNASHRAALERLTGTSGSRSKPDSQFRQQEDSSISRNQSLNTAGPPSHRSADLSQIPGRNVSTPQDQKNSVGLSVQDSPGLRSVDSPMPGDNTINPVQGRKRRSSVSFKEPYEKRRPTDEWKAAETARLTAPDFLLEPETDQNRNKAWWEDDPKSRRRNNQQKATLPAQAAVIDDRIAEFRPKLLLKCGPLLRYTGMKRTVGEGAQEYWRGTLMIVTQDSQSSYEKPPVLRLYSQPKTLFTRPEPVHHDQDEHSPEDMHEDHDPLVGTTKISRIGRALYMKPVSNLPMGRDVSMDETDDGLFESSPPITNTGDQAVSVAPVASRISADNGEKFSRHKEIKGVRLYADPDRDVTFWLFKLEIQLGVEQQHIGYRINNGAASGFWVPAAGQTMHIMFHSCNGFSLSVKPDEFSGPDPLWRDVLNAHQSRPFHVMIGGGDQIYNDRVMRDTHHFGEWTANKNPHYKHNAAFTSEMKEELETFYLENYCYWFSQGLFGVAGAQIPMVNMWDDHDIIDGFGSYPHHFMLSPVFSGLGNVAFKYYMLFQQHSVDLMTHADEPSWLLGYKPGPYINHLSRSIFVDLGKHVALLALDCRTERTKNQVLSLDTLDLALDRCRKEIVEGVTKHLIVLLGVPIAYPRMNWLESVLTSRAMDPVKALGRYGIIKGGLLNHFDGGVEVLDDLDDHWTAQHHKKERNEFIQDLQDLAAERSVRITILGGDVHLAAIGQFYSNPKLKIPKDRDHRYMPNVVSSAIVNTPPPEMLADVLNKRNKVHHLDSYTDEAMIPMFTHDVNFKKRNNKHLLPRRNWCSITEYIPGRTPPSSRSTSPSRAPSPARDEYDERPQPRRSNSLTRGDLNPRNLFRRLSSRRGQGPPTAYRDEYDNPNEELRATSFDEPRPDRGGPTSWNERSGLTRRATSETRHPNLRADRTSEDDTGRRPPPFRPGFHRRPTNLSEKAAKKGNMLAIDAEGNEFDVNDHVNLDGGLDIVLNCEIEKGDPRGSTLPYRLLVPALWYDGSSDREKLDGAEGLQRKPTLMNRLGMGSKRGRGTAQNQGAGEWGQESDEESLNENEREIQERPRKSLGLFSSFRKNKRVDGEQYDPDGQDHYGAAAGIVPEGQDYNTTSYNTGTDIFGRQKNFVPSTEVPGRSSFHEQVTQHDNTTTPKTTPPRMGFQAGPVMPYDAVNQNQVGFSNGPVQATPPKRSSSFKASNLLRKNSSKRQAQAQAQVQPQLQQPMMSDNYGTTALPSTYHQPQIQPSRQAPAHPYASTDPALGVERTNSYTIGTDRGSASRLPQPGAKSFDADSAYLSHQNRGASRAVSNPTSTAPSAYRAQNDANIQRNPSLHSTDTGASKQEQVLGIATDHDAFSGNPQQRSLRGNGILGRFGLGKQSASADRVPQVQHQNHNQYQDQYQADQTSQGRDEFGAPQRTMSQGYSGIDAYREKPKRGLSLRDRARNFVDRFEGKRRYDDDYRDDDDYSYHSSESYSSENLGETNDQHGHQKHEHGAESGHKRERDTQRTLPQNPTMSHHDDEFDDERSFMSGEEGEPLPEEKPKRSMSQRLKSGLGKMGSGRRSMDQSRDRDGEGVGYSGEPTKYY